MRNTLTKTLLAGTMLMAPIANTAYAEMHPEKTEAKTYTLSEVLKRAKNEIIKETNFRDFNNDGIQDVALTITEAEYRGQRRWAYTDKVEIYMGSIQDGKYKLTKAE